MKNSRFLKIFSINIPLFALLLSCSNNVSSPDLKDYVSSIDISVSFNILNFNDIHLSTVSDLDEQCIYIERLITSPRSLNLLSNEKSNVDLIVLNGDTFLGADQTVVSRFLEFIDSFEIPFAYTYGNHDFEGLYNSSFIEEVLNNCHYSMLLNPKDDVYGNSNYVINLTSGEQIRWQLYFFDSNSYYLGGYDVIHDDQIEWYKQQIRLANNLGPEIDGSRDDLIPSLAFFHIPFEEFEEAWANQDKQLYGVDGENYWYMGDGKVAHGYKDNDLFETMSNFRSTRAVICAHDHMNLANFLYCDEDSTFPINLIYGMKTGDELYHHSDLMGATLLTLDGASSNFDVKFIRANYEGEVGIIDINSFKTGIFHE